MTNKTQTELLKNIYILDAKAVHLQLKKGADSNFEYPKEVLNLEEIATYSDFYTPLEVLFLFQKEYTLDNPNTSKNKESELEIASLLMDYNANPKRALALATKMYGKFSLPNARKSGCSALWSTLFYQQAILEKNYSKLPKSILNKLLSDATAQLDLESMKLLLDLGASRKVMQTKMDLALVEAINESLETVVEVDESPDTDLIKKVEFLLQLGANPNYKTPKKAYQNYIYQEQPFSALRLLVFSISDSRKTNTNRHLELEIAKLLLQYGADAKCALKYAENRYGKYNRNGALDFGQQLLNLIASKIED
jgi:hypothetical protein